MKGDTIVDGLSIVAKLSEEPARSPDEHFVVGKQLSSSQGVEIAPEVSLDRRLAFPPHCDPLSGPSLLLLPSPSFSSLTRTRCPQQASIASRLGCASVSHCSSLDCTSAPKRRRLFLLILSHSGNHWLVVVRTLNLLTPTAPCQPSESAGKLANYCQLIHSRLVIATVLASSLVG